MDGFIYKWTNQINSRWYIGSHKGTVDDGYRHSSTLMCLAEEKYGFENFTREILFEGDYSNNKILDLETEYLNRNDAANDPMSYNLTNNAGKNCFNEATKQKMRKAKLGTVQSAEHIAKRRAALTGKPSWKKGIKTGPQGKKQIENRAATVRKSLVIDNIVYVSRTDAAKKIRVSRWTINEWLKNGKAINNG